MNRLTIIGLSKGMSKKLQLAYALIKGQFSQPAEDVYQHSMLVAAQKNARGKDRTILNTTVPQSKKDLLKSARENATLAALLEQMAQQYPECGLDINKNTLSA